MLNDRSVRELCLLHTLRDGDDPAAEFGVQERARFEDDVERLVARGLIQRSGALLALTLAGLDEISRPGNSRPVQGAWERPLATALPPRGR